MKTAYCFYRGNAADTKTFDRQKRICLRAARENQWDVDGEICEPAVSCMTRMIDRPCIQLLINKVVQHAFDVLIVSDIDRLGTNASELIALFQMLRENNVDVFSAAQDRQVDELSILDWVLAKQNRVCFMCRKEEK